jgi:hypothetical protein
LKLVAALVVLACAIAAGDPVTRATVKVEAVPGGDVTIDGKDFGPAPVLEQVLPGEHEVVVTRAGYRTFTLAVNVVAGQLLKVRAELHPAGTIKAASKPPGAQVFVDGALHGTTPLILEVDAGDHVVRFEKRDYVSTQRHVHVDAGKTVELAVALAQP